MIDNRNRWKANLSMDLVVARGVTVTPTFKYQDDHYGLAATEMGLTDSRSWAGGVDVVYVMNPDTSFMVGYEREFATQLLAGLNSASNTAVLTPATSATTNDRTVVDTFTAAVRYAAIPDKLNLSLRYAASHGVDNMMLLLGTGATPAAASSRMRQPGSSAWMRKRHTSSTRSRSLRSAGRATS